MATIVTGALTDEADNEVEDAGAPSWPEDALL